MSAFVWPPLSDPDRIKAEAETTVRELSWLLESLQETLTSLKSGLDECFTLLAPIEPGSTLVLSSPRSESLKGHVTRVGTKIVKGTLHLRLKTHPPTRLEILPALDVTSLTSLRELLNQALDCVDVTRWTGDRSSAPFISGQLRLLHSIILEALSLLSTTPSAPSLPPNPNSSVVNNAQKPPWCKNHPPAELFSPALPATLSLDLTLQDSSLLLTIRTLEPVSIQPNLGSRFAYAIGAQRRLEHDEMDDIFVYLGEEVRVKEKVVVESSADPSLLSLGAKLGALERTVGGCRGALHIVGDEED